MGHRKAPSAATLRRRIRKRARDHVTHLGFQRLPDGSLLPPAFNKDSLRQLHRAQRNERLSQNREFIESASARFLHHFASGTDIDAPSIKPRLELVTS